MELKETNLQSKYFVIKTDDFFEYVSEGEYGYLTHILDAIEEGRVKAGKKKYNEYVVVNLDEPWAHKIVEIVEKEYDLRSS